MKTQIVLMVLAAFGLSACASIPENSNGKPVCSTEPSQQYAQVCQTPQAGDRPNTWQRDREHFSGSRGRAAL